MLWGSLEGPKALSAVTDGGLGITGAREVGIWNWRGTLLSLAGVAGVQGKGAE